MDCHVRLLLVLLLAGAMFSVPPAGAASNCGAIFSFTIDADDPYTVHFNASASHGFNGIHDPSTYAWDFGDGTSLPADAGNVLVSHTYPNDADYYVTLEVQCATAADKGERTITITPKDDTSQPANTCHAAFSVRSENGVMVLDASASHDNGSAQGLRYSWGMGDTEDLALSDNPTTTLDPAPGRHEVTLYLDCPSGSAQASKIVEVQKDTTVDQNVPKEKGQQKEEQAGPAAGGGGAPSSPAADDEHLDDEPDQGVLVIGLIVAAAMGTAGVLVVRRMKRG